MTTGGEAGTAGDRAVTSGGWGVTSGEGRRDARLAWLIFAAVGFVNCAVNATSVIDDRADVGSPVPAWEPWTWEVTSFVTWLALVPLIFLAAAHLRPQRLGWPLTLVLHAAISVVVSLAHVAGMTLLRMAVYAALGGRYHDDDPIRDVLIYEYRKDLVTYAVVVLIFLFVRRLLAPAPSTVEPHRSDFRLEVRDGSRTVRLAPGDIEWAQAAGNYVELHGAFGTLLDRRTLAALEELLAPHGFRRIHRSRIVRTDAIRAIETRPSGDFEVALAGGESITGSRRYRGALEDNHYKQEGM